ncbi:MAG: hypothetical protein M0P20_09590, partial [Methanocorpusculum sp.]|nr:hypothetical protein [Methanocorpusculum sp.]
MKKFMVRVFVLCFALVNLLPLTALATGSNEGPREPYEKVAAKSGRWYAEQLAYDGKTNLVVGYTGSYESNETDLMKFEIREKIVLSGIYIPFLGSPSENIILSLTDAKGNIYKGFSMEMQKTGGMKEANESGSFSD